MKKIIIILLIIIVCIVLGFFVATYTSDEMKGLPPLKTVEKTLKNFKDTIMTLLGYPPPKKGPPPLHMDKEGFATHGISMSPEEITKAQQYFNSLAGIDVEKRKAEKEEKKKKEAEAKEKAKEEKAKAEEEKKVKIPTSLFPVKKKRKSLAANDKMKSGAIYSYGTSPYGPPPFVKAKIFSPGSLLHIQHDPNKATHHQSGTRPYKKPHHLLPLMKKPIQNITKTVLDPGDAYTLQMGTFESQKAANKLMHKLTAKGYDVSVYSGKERAGSTWYSVRLNEALGLLEAEERAQDMGDTQHIYPMVVPFTKEDLKKSLGE